MVEQTVPQMLPITEAELETAPVGLYRLPDAKRDIIFIATTNEWALGDLVEVARVWPDECSIPLSCGVDVVVRRDGKMVTKHFVMLDRLIEMDATETYGLQMPAIREHMERKLANAA